MNDNVLYELVVEKNHLTLIKQSLSLQINNLYEAVDADVVDTEKAYEDIKVLSDMLAVLRGSSRELKQTSQTTGLIWLKEAFAPQETPEPFEHNSTELKPFNDVNLQSYTCEDEFSELTEEQIEYLNGRMKRSWNNVKDRHWDTIKRIGDK